jgi:hypothetical protein
MNQLRGGTLLIPSKIDLGFSRREELTLKLLNVYVLLFVALSHFSVHPVSVRRKKNHINCDGWRHMGAAGWFQLRFQATVQTKLGF